MIQEIPTGALGQEVVVRVGWNDETLSLPSGAPSGMVAVIEFGQAPSLAQPATIIVPFDAKKIGGPVLVYTINDQGGLDMLMLARLDRTAGLAAFHAFRSLTMTWVYLEMSCGSLLAAVSPGRGIAPHAPNGEDWMVRHASAATGHGRREGSVGLRTAVRRVSRPFSWNRPFSPETP
jgi:hypothetical protein